MADDKKPSTSDILAKIRAQKAAASGAAPDVPAETAPAAAAPPASEPVAAAPAKPVAPAAKPGSTADIMAAIRAKKAGASPAAEAPAAAAPVAAAPKAVTSTGGAKPSVQDMLKAIREGKPGAAAAAVTPAATEDKPVKVAPPMPTKPVPAAKKGAAPAPARRSLGSFVAVAAISFTCIVTGSIASSPLLIAIGVFVWGALMSPFAAAWTAMATVTGASVLGTARFMFPNVLVEPPSKFKVGVASDFPLNTVSNKFKDQFGVWIVHTDQYQGQNVVVALSTVCTHLGCTPSWLDGEQKFKCPCHGSGFYINGVNFEGPAPRPLERYGIRIAEDGMLEVDKSVKFQEEMGQWRDATCYVEVV